MWNDVFVQGDSDKKEMTDDEMDKFDEKRGEAMSAFSEVAKLFWTFLKSLLQGEWEAAIALFTEAIKLNPNSAAMFAKRGWVSVGISSLQMMDFFSNFRITISGRVSSRFRNQMHASGIAQGEKLLIVIWMILNRLSGQ